MIGSIYHSFMISMSRTDVVEGAHVTLLKGELTGAVRAQRLSYNHTALYNEEDAPARYRRAASASTRTPITRSSRFVSSDQ
jgi:hypothetical protein